MQRPVSPHGMSEQQIRIITCIPACFEFKLVRTNSQPLDGLLRMANVQIEVEESFAVPLAAVVFNIPTWVAHAEPNEEIGIDFTTRFKAGPFFVPRRHLKKQRTCEASGTRTVAGGRTTGCWHSEKT